MLIELRQPVHQHGRFPSESFILPHTQYPRLYFSDNIIRMSLGG